MLDLRSCAPAAALFVLALSLAGCGTGGSDDAAPRIGTIPVQVGSGGQMFSLDLSDYVTDREGQALTYAVVSGGGSFAGAVYSHTFDTLGAYPVQFQVADTAGGVTTGGFTVVMQTANLAIVGDGDDLQLLDTDTRSFRTVSGATGFMDTLKTTLPTGHVVFERDQGTGRLFVYDPNTGATASLGDSNDFDTRYAAKTSDHRIVFTRARVVAPTDTDLFVWEPVSGLVTTISNVASAPDGNAMATGELIYYETGTPSDIYVYDPEMGVSTAVASGSTAETLRAVLASGAVVFSRIGAGGEQDLFHYMPSAGVVEIGADLSSTIQAQTKTYAGALSTGQIVFEVTGASSIDLYVWNPSNGASAAIATSSDDDVFAAVTPLDEVVFHQVKAGPDRDVFVYTFGAGTPLRTVAATSGDETYQGVLSNGDFVVLDDNATGDDLYVYDTSASALNALTSGTDDDAFDAVLANDKVVYTRSGGSGGVFVVDTSGTSQLVGGPGSTFAGATSGGDFAVQTTVSSQLDLVLWDESAASVVTISDEDGDDSFGSAASNGDVLFLRKVPGKTTSDLFAWTPSTLATTQLTDSSKDQAVLMTFSADNR